MTPGIAELLDKDYGIDTLTSPVVVYGAGSTGRCVSDYLISAGYAVSAILDINAKAGESWNGREIRRPADWAAVSDAASHTALIAIHNHAVDTAAAIRHVRQLGFHRVLNMIDFHNLFPNDQPFRYWLAPRTFYRPFGGELTQTHAMLADDSSREWFEKVVTFRLTGEYDRLPAPSTGDQYCPKDIQRWDNPMRLVDCGAFEGDTLAQFSTLEKFQFAAIAAFEPDPDNFSKLASGIASYGCPAVCFPCGVSGSTSLVRFEAGNGMASRSSVNGSTAIQCVALDEALANFRPTLIKMDIEGAEIDALRGARKIIAESRPGLAISLYHRPGHIWEVPLLLRDWDLGYRLFIRGHGQNSFDLVLYAVPVTH